MSEQIKEQVQQWTDFLFSDFRSVGLFYCISQNLYVGLAEQYQLSKSDSPTASGVVLNPSDAGQCLTEMQRTEAFVKGLDQAIQVKKAEGKAPVRVFYAGCGPFATLILPLTFRYSPEELRVTILDYHQQSIDSATHLLESLGKEAYIEGAVVHDAVTYKVPEGYQPDIFLTETLQRALTQECQVPIVCNLLPQFSEDVILVPREIRVHGLWTELPKGEENRAAVTPHDVETDPIIRFNADTARSGRYVFGVEGKAAANDAQTFCLQTEIDVFGEWKLRRNETGLTCPHPMPEVKVKPGEILHFEYEVSGQPGLRQVSSV